MSDDQRNPLDEVAEPGDIALLWHSDANKRKSQRDRTQMIAEYYGMTFRQAESRVAHAKREGLIK